MQYELNEEENNVLFRTVLWCCLGLSVVHCFVFPFMPESPAFLAAKGKEKVWYCAVRHL